MLLNREIFYDNIRANALFEHMTQGQVDGINAILDEWERRGLTDFRWLAYILATAYHETARTMKPIEEFGKGKGRKYGSKIKHSGMAYTTPDHIYYGRGHTQNTWYEIYEMLTKEATLQGKGWDFLNHPELLLTMEPSIWATFVAMIGGKYTGVGLSKYFNGEKADWVNARKIINGLDAAEKIADYGRRFYKSLITVK